MGLSRLHFLTPRRAHYTQLNIDELRANNLLKRVFDARLEISIPSQRSPTMSAERFTPCGDTDRRPEDEFHGGRRDWRRWLDKAEAWDPERWKAMASIWSGLWQDAAKEAHAEPGSDTMTKICPYCAEEIKRAAIKCKHCATWLVPVPEQARYDFMSGQGEKGSATGKEYDSPRLTRSTADAMAAGVLSGLGRFFGVDPTWLRIAYVLATIFTAVVPGIAVYAILAVVIPADAPDNDPGPA
jgi:phage shock protein PspC (stress-responsive transcriptional regulator)